MQTKTQARVIAAMKFVEQAENCNAMPFTTIVEAFRFQNGRANRPMISHAISQMVEQGIVTKQEFQGMTPVFKRVV